VLIIGEIIMAKNKVQVEEQEFHTKEFKAYFSFDVKEEGMQDENGNEILKIKGMANFSGDVDDENSVFVDHTGDVIVPSGFDLSIYKTNPQILWQHNRDYSIGKGLKAIKKKDGLEIEAEIHKNAMEEEDWYRVKNGLVTKFSVGFRTMAGEWREIKKTPVFFITKALLMETSIVTIPCNAASGFSIIKSLGDDTFSFGDIEEKQEVQPTQQPAVTNKEIGDDKMKMKLRDLLAEDKVKELEALGLTEKLEEETDVDVKAFVEAKIKQELVIFKEALLAELKAEVETEVKEEVPATPSTETEVTTEEKEKEAEEVKEDEVDEAQLKALTEAVEKLKTLI
jgi:HK97 family phage prohead protease